MPKRTTDYRTTLLEDLKNPEEAANYLNAALDDSPEMFLAAMRDVAEARQMAKVAETAGVSRESLYRMLKLSGNPTYNSFLSIVKAIGLEFAGVRVPPSEIHLTSGPLIIRKAKNSPSLKSGKRRRGPRKFGSSNIPLGRLDLLPTAVGSSGSATTVLRKPPATETAQLGSMSEDLWQKAGVAQLRIGAGAAIGR